MLHSSDHLHCPPLVPLQWVYVFLMLQAPELHTVLQVGSITSSDLQDALLLKQTKIWLPFWAAGAHRGSSWAFHPPAPPHPSPQGCTLSTHCPVCLVLPQTRYTEEYLVKKSEWPGYFSASFHCKGDSPLQSDRQTYIMPCFMKQKGNIMQTRHIRNLLMWTILISDMNPPPPPEILCQPPRLVKNSIQSLKQSPFTELVFFKILLTALRYKSTSRAYRKEPEQTITNHLSGFISHGFLVYLAAMVTFHFK